MKTPLLAFLSILLLLVGGIAATAEIEKGQTRQEVIEILGEPSGYIGSDTYQIYYFERGEVTFRNGMVESFEVISPETAERKAMERELARERRAEQRALLAERRAAEREQRIAEGTAIRDQRRADPQFSALDAESRLAFWQVFREKYPEVDVELEYSVALREVSLARAEKNAENERQLQIAQLEQRVREAEQKAETAEQKADRSVYYDSYRYGYYYPVRTSPVIIRSYPTYRNDYHNKKKDYQRDRGHGHGDRDRHSGHSRKKSDYSSQPKVHRQPTSGPKTTFYETRDAMRESFNRMNGLSRPSTRTEAMR